MKNDDRNFSAGEEDLLRAAMSKDRADQVPFAELIKERARNAAENQELNSDDETQFPNWSKSVAGFLPFVSKVSPSSVTVGTLGWHSVLAFFALPVVGVLMLLFSMFFALKKIRVAAVGDERELAESLAAEDALRQWWGRYKWALGAAYLLAIAVWTFQGTAGVGVVLAAAVIAVALFIGMLGRYGLATRRRVACCFFFWFFFLTQFAQTLYLWLPGQEAFLLDPSWIPILLGVGAVLSAVLSPIANALEGVRCVALVIGAIAVASISGRLALKPAVVDNSKVVSYCNSFDKGIFSSNMWKEWGLVSKWMQDRGEKPDLTRARELLEEELLAARSNKNGRLPVYVLGVATRFDLLSHDELKEFLWRDAVARSVNDLVNVKINDRSITHLAQREWLIRALMTTESLTPNKISVIESRLLATWPKASDWNALQEMRRIIVLLGVLNRPLEPSEYEGRVHEALVENWVGKSETRSGGFKAYDDSDHSDLLATVAAVELMAQFGVPKEINRRQMKSYLAAEAKGNGFISPRHWFNYAAMAALDRLNREVGYEELGFMDALLSERFIIAICLMILLATYSILSTKDLGEPMARRAGRPLGSPFK